MEKQEVEELLAFRLPRYSQLPELGLYLDQTLSYVAGVIHPLYGQPYAITGAMVSNYIKTGALEPSIRKKYGREHLARLVVISLLKEVFTVPEICALFQVQKETYPLEISYDYFCTEFENALRETFSPTGNPLPMVATAETDQTVLHLRGKGPGGGLPADWRHFRRDLPQREGPRRIVAQVHPWRLHPLDPAKPAKRRRRGAF